MRLLLIEDDVALGEGIHQALGREGYTVDWVQDGASALHSLLSAICAPGVKPSLFCARTGAAARRERSVWFSRHVGLRGLS